MDSSPIPANNSIPSQPNPTEPETTSQQPKKRNPAFSKESLRSTLEEISRETEQISQVLPKQPVNEDITKQIEKLDQKQRVWLRLYIVWLIYNLKGFAALFIEIFSMAQLPEELEEYEEIIKPMMHLGILIQFATTLIMSSPYLIQLWAIYKRSLKRTNTFIKIMKVLIVLNAISLAFSCLIIYKFDQVQELIASGAFPISEEEKEMLNLYTKENFMLSALYETMETLVYFLLCIGGAIKYRNYLTERESLKEKINKVD